MEKGIEKISREKIKVGFDGLHNPPLPMKLVPTHKDSPE